MICAENLSVKDTSFGKFYILPNDLICASIKDTGSWDWHLISAMQTLSAGQHAIDAGANVGFFTILLANRGVTVEAFEPCSVVDLLKDNVELNGVQDLVHVHKTALYDSEVQLQLDKEHWPGYQLREDGELAYENAACTGQMVLKPGGQGPYTVMARTIDSYRFDDIALIKVDVQGCDLRVLKGARETILRSKPLLCYEFESPLAPVHGESFESYGQFLEEIGYRVHSVFYPDSNRPDEYSDFVAVPKSEER